MQYHGGKTRQAKRIAEVIAPYAFGKVPRYHEPFVGGGSSLVATIKTGGFKRYTACDAHPDLVLLWNAVLSGWVPPETLSESEWRELKSADPSPLRGFAGFGVSFGGRFFEGYARNNRGDDFCGAARRGLLAKAETLRSVGAQIRYQNFFEFSPAYPCVIYCDPPYSGTTGYSLKFDNDSFWVRCRELAVAGSRVFVSEYSAPEWAECVWERDAVKSLNKDTNTESAVEKLYRVHP